MGKIFFFWMIFVRVMILVTMNDYFIIKGIATKGRPQRVCISMHLKTRERTGRHAKHLYFLLSSIATQIINLVTAAVVIGVVS